MQHTGHFKEICITHGTVIMQCKCMGPKTIRKGSCIDPKWCEAQLMKTFNNLYDAPDPSTRVPDPSL